MRQLVIALCLLVLPVGVHVQDGRWKTGDDGSCYFDPNDSGPDQCTPAASQAGTSGRWKLGGDGSCYFDPSDVGPDQCSASASAATAAGRWKLGGDGSCYFDPNDSGPDQCQPAEDPTLSRR